MHLLRRDQVPSLEGRSPGSAVLLQTVGRVFADTLGGNAGRGAGLGSWAGTVLHPEPP